MIIGPGVVFVNPLGGDQAAFTRRHGEVHDQDVDVALFNPHVGQSH